MLLGNFIITDHAIEQYSFRVKFKSKGDIIKSIKHDLRTLNIKNIVRNGNQVHVFTKGYKEFIFTKGKTKLYLKTVIKRNYDDTRYTIYKRKKLVTI